MKRKKLVELFDQKINHRRKGLSKFLVLPNLVDEYTKSPLISILFFVLVYKVYLEVNQILVYNIVIPAPPVLDQLSKIWNEGIIQFQKPETSNDSSSIENQDTDQPPEKRKLHETPRLLQDVQDSFSNKQTQNSDSGNSDSSDSEEKDQHMYQLFFYFCALILGFVLFCLIFGNSPQFKCHWVLALIFLISLMLTGMQLYFSTLNLWDFKIIISVPCFAMTAFLAIITRDSIGQKGWFISSFHANRAYVYNEYCFQRLFQRPSIMWGMRFERYSRFEKYFDVQVEFPDTSNESSPSNKYVTHDTEHKGIKEPEESKKSLDSKKHDLSLGGLYHRKRFTVFQNRGFVKLQKVIFSKSEMKQLKTDWLDSGMKFSSSLFKIEYQKLYDFYQANGIDHSLAISQDEKLKTKRTNPNNNTMIRNMIETLLPFSFYKRRLFVNYPLYFPSKLLICLFLQFFVQSEMVFQLIQMYVQATNKDINWIKSIPDIIDTSLDFLFLSARISFIAVIVLFIVIAIYSVYRMLRSFMVSVFNMRLNGMDLIIGRSHIWPSTLFIQYYIGNITFSSFPFLLAFFVFFFCVSNPFFWWFVWTQRSVWLAPVLVFFFEVVLDAVLKKLTDYGFHFRNRVLIRVFDIFKMVLGFYSGLLLGFVRFFISLLFINITMFRVDKTGIPKWIYNIFNLDLVNNTYHGFLRLYHTHNNPIVLAFVGTLMDNVIQARKHGRSREGVRLLKKKLTENSENQTTAENNLLSEEYLRDDREPNLKDTIGKNDNSIEKPFLLKDKHRYLKVAYKWQYYAFLVRNSKLWEFRKTCVEKKVKEVNQNGISPLLDIM